MSLYHRLNLTKPNRKLQLPIGERINLDRPSKPGCQRCRSRLQTHWLWCTLCGWSVAGKDGESRHCIWVDIAGINIGGEESKTIFEILADAFAKIFSAFRSVNVFLTSDLPNKGEWGENFTHVYVFADNEPVDYLGIASFSQGQVTKFAGVRIDQIFNASCWASLNVNQLANLIANTIAHEIGHTLGLDHSQLPTDVMHDGLDHRVHSLMPPSFHAEQINLMNKAIREHNSF